MDIGAIITAAGLSSRMGAFKPLLSFKGKTVIENTVGTVLSVITEPAVVVTGYRAEEIEEILKKAFGDRVVTVCNRSYRDTDMLYSVKTGLRFLPECDAFFFLPGDMPAVRPETLRLLIEKAAETEDRIPDVTFPETAGRSGHPPLISAKLIPAILSYEGEGGLRGFWKSCGADMIRVPVEDEGVMTDLDTPEDYEKLKSRA